MLLEISADNIPKLIGQITFYALVAIVVIWAILKSRKNN